MSGSQACRCAVRSCISGTIDLHHFLEEAEVYNLTESVWIYPRTGKIPPEKVKLVITVSTRQPVRREIAGQFYCGLSFGKPMHITSPGNSQEHGLCFFTKTASIRRAV